MNIINTINRPLESGLDQSIIVPPMALGTDRNTAVSIRPLGRPESPLVLLPRGISDAKLLEQLESKISLCG